MLRSPVPSSFVPARIRAAVALVALAVAAAGCDAASSAPAGKRTASGTSSSSGATGGSGAASSSGASGASGGSSSGGPSSSGAVGSSGTGTVCRIATIGWPGSWGKGDVFKDWLQAKSTQGTTALTDTVLTADVLAPFQIVVVLDVRLGSAGQSASGQGIGRSFSADEVAALQQWVARGGGLMTTIGYAVTSEVANVNTLLAPFEMSYTGTPVLAGGGGYTVPVTHWADHPIAKGVSKVGVDNGYPTAGAGTVVAWELTPEQRDMGRALEGGTAGKGHVFAWGDEWITYNSEWNSKPEYQVAQLWANTLTWLSGTSGCEVPLPPGEW
jgi:hypothetical protein